MPCVNVIVTASLEIGAVQLSRLSGEPLTVPTPAVVPAALVADAFSACGSQNAPLTRWPGWFELGSLTLSRASPADETTFAVEDAVYVFATPG